MRLIDAESMALNESLAYQDTIGQVDKLTAGINYVVHTKIQMIIRDTDTVDAEPVTRCGECRHSYELTRTSDKTTCKCLYSSFVKDAEKDFCSWSLPREDNK